MWPGAAAAGLTATLACAVAWRTGAGAVRAFWRRLTVAAGFMTVATASCARDVLFPEAGPPRMNPVTGGLFLIAIGVAVIGMLRLPSRQRTPTTRPARPRAGRRDAVGLPARAGARPRPVPRVVPPVAVTPAPPVTPPAQPAPPAQAAPLPPIPGAPGGGPYPSVPVPGVRRSMPLPPIPGRDLDGSPY